MSLGAPAPNVADQSISLGSNLAGEQQTMNTGAATGSQAGSNYNSSNPYENVNYVQTGTGPNGVPTYTSESTLSAPEQGLFNTQVGGQQSAGTGSANLIAGANYGSQSPSDAIGSLTSGLTNQIMGQETAALDPFFSTQTSQLQSQLANQGIDPNSPAYANAMRQNTVNQGQVVSGFEAQTMPQIMSQATTEYDQPAQLGESLGTYGAPTSTGAAAGTGSGLSIAPAQIASDISAVAGPEQAQYQDQYQQYSNMLSGLFGIGSNTLGGMASAGMFA